MRRIVYIAFVILGVCFYGSACAQNQASQRDSLQIPSKPADSWFGQDKAKHFLLSAVITGAVSYQAKYQHDWSLKNSQYLGAGVSFSLGLAKECRDRHRPNGYFSWKDLVFDVLGVAVGIGVFSQW